MKITEHQAREVLREKGYYVDNLWHIDDVMDKYDTDEKGAFKVLNLALQGDGAMMNTWESIDASADYFNIKELRD